MRSYHWSNQNEQFNKSNIMNLPLFFTTEKIYVTFYDTNNYMNGKYNSCRASIFNETHIFRSEYSFHIYTEKRKEEKIEFEQSSWRHKIQLIKVMCLIGCQGKIPLKESFPWGVRDGVKVSFGIGLGLGSDGLNGLIDNSKY